MLEIQVSLCLSGEVDLSRSLKNKIKTAMIPVKGLREIAARVRGVCKDPEGERHEPDSLCVVGSGSGYSAFTVGNQTSDGTQRRNNTLVLRFLLCTVSFIRDQLIFNDSFLMGMM